MLHIPSNDFQVRVHPAASFRAFLAAVPLLVLLAEPEIARAGGGAREPVAGIGAAGAGVLRAPTPLPPGVPREAFREPLAESSRSPGTHAAVLEDDFGDVTATAGVGDSGDGLGLAWGDMDGDGDLDLYVANFNGQPNRMYRNDGGGVFADVSAISGTSLPGSSSGVAFGDYDNDGDLDLYVANWGPNRLYRNEGAGVFTEIGAASGTDDPSQGYGVAWADFDLDGDLDLYVVNFAQPNRLYRNEGGERFVDVGPVSGTADAGRGYGAAWADYDRDGDPDLFVVNNGEVSRLYRNEGAGTFANVAAEAGVGSVGYGEGAAWGDYDSDGDPDLYVTCWGQANRLYRNRGDGTFTDVAAASGTADAGYSWGAAWGDYDNDGDLDLYVSNYTQPNRLYRNEGSGVFADLSPFSWTADAGRGTGVAWGDFDGDGSLDLYLVNYGQPNRLFRQAGANGRHRLQVDLVGTFSNRSGIGARVCGYVGGVPRGCDLSGGSGLGTQNSLTAQVGMGDAVTLDSLVVRWPSGIVWDTTGVVADQRITIVERELYVAVPGRAPAAPGPELSAAVPNPARDGARLSFTLPGAADVRLTLHDVQGRLVATVVRGVRTAGRHEASWDGRAATGNRAPAGVYLARLEVRAAGGGPVVRSTRIVLTR